MTVKEAIKMRHSVRSYTDETPTFEFGRNLCSKYSQLEAVDPGVIGSGKVGTYGSITGKPAYVAVVVGDEFQAGLQGEQLILELTRYSYGTCWLGGTYNRELAEKGIKLPEGTNVPAVIAVGRATGHKNFFDRIVRTIARSSRRMPIQKFILSGVPRPDVVEALEAVRLAPSARNLQPWRFVFNDDHTIDVFGSSEDRFMRLDCGIAVAHFLAINPKFDIVENTKTHPEFEPIVTLIPKNE